MAHHIHRSYISNISSEIIEINGSKFLHLVSVLRLKENDKLFVFNEKEGEWLCSIVSIKKYYLIAKKVEFIRSKELNLYRFAIAFCPIKQDKSKLIIEKCTELGVTDFYIIKSKYTNNDVNIDKLKSIAISASEQSERLDIPNIYEITPLDLFLKDLPCDIKWFSAIERSIESKHISEIDFKSNCGFIIGPEGGFSEEEKTILKEKTISINISKNILRSETAAIACSSIFSSSYK